MKVRAFLPMVAASLFMASAIAHAADASAASELATLQRGGQLSAAGDCIVCHTARGGAPFAGGLPIHTPFGTIYSTNITPDPKTGIGGWTLDAFTQAMRQGRSRDGHLLYPAFPYVHFTRMTDADIASVYAYIMSRTPVEATAPANELIFPLNVRALLAAWNLLYLRAGASVPLSRTQDAQLDRGHYLVDSLGHCSACHTPLNLLGAEKQDHLLDGAVIDGWDAPSLKTLRDAPTPWTREQLSAYLRTGFASEHGAAAGPMLPVTRSLSNASEEDVKAMAAYVMSIQADATPRHAEPDARPMDVHAGATLFEGSCAACHAANSPMNTAGGRPLLSQGTSVVSDSPRNAVRVILDGIAAQTGHASPGMPPFAAMLSDAQIADLVNYVRAQYSHRTAWMVQAGDVTKYRKQTEKTSTP